MIPQVVHCLQQLVLYIADSAGVGKVDAGDEGVEVSPDRAKRQTPIVLAPVYESLHHILCSLTSKEAAIQGANTARLTLYPPQEP